MDNHAMQAVLEPIDMTPFVQAAKAKLVAKSTLAVQIEIITRSYANEYGDDPGSDLAPTGEWRCRFLCFFCCCFWVWLWLWLWLWLYNTNAQHSTT